MSHFEPVDFLCFLSVPIFLQSCDFLGFSILWVAKAFAKLQAIVHPDLKGDSHGLILWGA